MMIRRSRPTIAWYSLDRRTATGSTTSLASYTNPPASAAPALAVRSGRDARYDRDRAVWAPVLLFASFTAGLLWFSIALGPAHSLAVVPALYARPRAGTWGAWPNSISPVGRLVIRRARALSWREHRPRHPPRAVPAWVSV